MFVVCRHYRYYHYPNITDSFLNEDAKKLLDDLARALPGIKYQEDSKGNREYEHKDVSPFVKPLLAAIGLKVSSENHIYRETLIRFSGLEVHGLDVSYIIQIGEITRAY